MTTRVVALGDSTSCGEGVGLRLAVEDTWPARLAQALPGSELLPLATAGARVRDVRAGQLPAAVAARPHVASVFAGLNDVCRGGFDADGIHGDVGAVVRALRESGATVLLVRLHDPGDILPLPRRLRLEVTRRAGVVNAAVDAAAEQSGVHVLDLARLPGLASRAAWAVDRLHPSALAHGELAEAAARTLDEAGYPVHRTPVCRADGRSPGRVAEAWWATRHGLPWLACHVRDVLVPALAARRP